MGKQFTVEELKGICCEPTICGICLKQSMRIDGHVCLTCQDAVPRRLPVVSIRNGKRYFFDKRLWQLRNIKDPCDFVDLR